MKKQLIILMILLTIMPNVIALKVTLGNPQAVFDNKSIGDEIEYSLIPRNYNNFSVTIKIKPSNENIIFNHSLEFVLFPNESREIEYKLLLEKSGNYSISIPVLFSGNNESFSLSQNLFLSVVEIINDNDSKDGEGDSGGSDSIKETIDFSDKEVPEEDLEEDSNVNFNLTTQESKDQPKGPPKKDFNSFILMGFLSLFALVVIIIIIIIYRLKWKEKENE